MRCFTSITLLWRSTESCRQQCCCSPAAKRCCFPFKAHQLIQYVTFRHTMFARALPKSAVQSTTKTTYQAGIHAHIHQGFPKRPTQLLQGPVHTITQALPGALTSSPQLLHDVADLALLDSSGVFNPLTLILPISAALAGTAALKFYLYSQLEYITASMLSKYVPKGGTGATVMQLGGGTRELYYYPKDTMTVVNVGEKVNKGLMEQAGVTAAVPTIVRKQPVTDLGFQADSSVDAVIALGVLSELNQQQRQQCIDEIVRVLRPGMPLIYVEPVKEGGSPLRGLVGVSAGKQPLPTADFADLKQSPAFSYTQFDVALQGQDPHAVGVAVRSETYRARKKSSEADEDAKRQRKKDNKREKAARGFQ